MISRAGPNSWLRDTLFEYFTPDLQNNQTRLGIGFYRDGFCKGPGHGRIKGSFDHPFLMWRDGLLGVLYAGTAAGARGFADDEGLRAGVGKLERGRYGGTFLDFTKIMGGFDPIESSERMRQNGRCHEGDKKCSKDFLGFHSFERGLMDDN